jgi:hypothetical protein
MKNCFGWPAQIRSWQWTRCWNWKSALFSSAYRGAVFFFSNLRSGIHAAVGAMLAEFAYRGLTAGFYGAATQSLSHARPRWLASAGAIVGMPLVSHAIEFAVHWARGTPHLKTSMFASVGFTVLSTLFNLHAMRHGVLVTGSEGRSLREDLRALPQTIRSFGGSGFELLRQLAGKVRQCFVPCI